MSAVTRKVRRLERYRAKEKTKATAELQGQGKSRSLAARVEIFKKVLGLKKSTGKLCKEFAGLDLAALTTKLADARKDLFNMRFKHATGQLENVAAIPTTKRQIARILTLIRQKEMGA